MATSVALGTATQVSIYSITNNDLVNGTQNYAFDLKMGYITVPASSSRQSTIDVNLFAEFGIKRFLGIKGYAHTTEDSVIVAENPTTTVNNGKLTITIANSNDDAKRFYVIVGV